MLGSSIYFNDRYDRNTVKYVIRFRTMEQSYVTEFVTEYMIECMKKCSMEKPLPITFLMRLADTLCDFPQPLGDVICTASVPEHCLHILNQEFRFFPCSKMPTFIVPLLKHKRTQSFTK